MATYAKQGRHPKARDRVRELHGKGLPARAIATLTGLSTQGVYYHLKRLKAEDQNGHGTRKAGVR